MMGLSTMRSMAQEAAARAAESGTEPFTVEQHDVEGWENVLAEGNHPRFPFPFIGDHQPEGWEPTGEEYFVDTSGMGRSDEPALTAEQLVARLTVGRGYALTQVGQFQAYLAEYRRVV